MPKVHPEMMKDDALVRGLDAAPYEEQKVARWLKLQLAKKQLSRFELRECGMGDLQQRCAFWTPEDFEEKDPEEMALMIVRAAQEDAEGRRGELRYAVCAYEEGEGRYASRTFFKVVPPAEDDDDVLMGDSYSPDAKGLVAQAIKHAENKERLFIGSLRETFQVFHQLMSRLDSHNTRLEQMFLTMLDVTQKAEDRKAEREILAQKSAMVEKRKNVIFNDVSKLFPVILKKMLGGDKDFAAMLGEEQLDKILGSLNREQMTSIMDALDDGQKIALATLYKEYAERHKAREKAEEDPAAARNGASTKTTAATANGHAKAAVEEAPKKDEPPPCPPGSGEEAG